MKIKIAQECGQKWYRRRCWRARPLWRKLRTAQLKITGNDVLLGGYYDSKSVETKWRLDGVAFGPIMFYWRYR
jgi:hypothetical protein